MDERASLLAAALADPADDTARLVLSDFLRESAAAADQSLGRFLWAGVTASTFRSGDGLDDPLWLSAQRELHAVAIAGWPARWLSAIGPSPLTDRDWYWDSTLDRVTVRVGDVAAVLTRVLLSELTLTLGEWYSVAPAALRSWPVERVAASDTPGLAFAVEHRGVDGWKLSARLRVPGRRVPLAGGRIVPTVVSPLPFLDDGPGDWRVEEVFADRQALVAGAARASASLVADLQELAGDRWPPPLPRKRR